MNKSKYLVRPHDFSIFEIDDSNGCYRAYKQEGKVIENRPNAYAHFTYKNLVENYGFIPIDEYDIKHYTKKNKLYHDWISWSTRPDGHGGSKGGTMEEYLAQRK